MRFVDTCFVHTFIRADMLSYVNSLEIENHSLDDEIRKYAFCFFHSRLLENLSTPLKLCCFFLSLFCLV